MAQPLKPPSISPTREPIVPQQEVCQISLSNDIPHQPEVVLAHPPPPSLPPHHTQHQYSNIPQLGPEHSSAVPPHSQVYYIMQDNCC